MVPTELQALLYTLLHSRRHISREMSTYPFIRSPRSQRRLSLKTWKWRQKVSPKRWYKITRCRKSEDQEIPGDMRRIKGRPTGLAYVNRTESLSFNLSCHRNGHSIKSSVPGMVKPILRSSCFKHNAIWTQYQQELAAESPLRKSVNRKYWRSWTSVKSIKYTGRNSDVTRTHAQHGSPSCANNIPSTWKRKSTQT